MAVKEWIARKCLLRSFEPVFGYTLTLFLHDVSLVQIRLITFETWPERGTRYSSLSRSCQTADPGISKILSSPLHNTGFEVKQRFLTPGRAGSIAHQVINPLDAN